MECVHRAATAYSLAAGVSMIEMMTLVFLIRRMLSDAWKNLEKRIRLPKWGGSEVRPCIRGGLGR